MAVWYLDNDDEITDAVARLRGTRDERVVFVVPPGSRIATGRINFRLLAREAEVRSKAMAIASPDEQVRALAVSAGVLAAATADEAMAALERGEAPVPAEVAPPEGREQDLRSPIAPGTTAGKTTGGRSLRWRSQRVRVATMGMLALAIVGLFVGSQVLPSASITLQPRVSELGPLDLVVVALPSLSQPDPQRGQVPAVTLPIPLTVEGTFTASGSEAIEARASGEVVFTSPAQAPEQVIPAGTRLRTDDGVEFQTTVSVTLPATDDAPAEVRASVEADKSGSEGNVPADTITSVPSLEGAGISVTNPAPTSGGRFEQSPRVTAEDYEAAAVDLQNKLTVARQAYLNDPVNTPEGLTLFPSTAQLGEVTYQPAADVVVGESVAQFTLSATAAGRVLAVDEQLVEEVAREHLLASIPEHSRALPGNERVEVEKGAAEGQRVDFATRASTSIYPVVDPESLAEQVAGLPVSEARAILEGFGTATVDIWPEFLDGLPADRGRISLEVTEPSTTE